MSIIKMDCNYGAGREDVTRKHVANETLAPSETSSIGQACNHDLIDIDVLEMNICKHAIGLIEPAKEDVCCEIAPEHAADPIKSMDDILRISEYLISNGRYRDNMLFIVGINFGLRVSDLRMLRFSNLINDNLTFKDSFPVFEKKTRNTRKKKKNRYITVNNAVIEAVRLYLRNTSGVSLSDYMFRGESNRCKNKNQPLTNMSIDRILKGIASDLNLNMNMSTHTLRKTFCYWMMVYGNNDTRRLLLLQKMLNHSSPAQTLDYIGLTREEIDDAYKNLNLGSGNYISLIDGKIGEVEAM